MATSKLVVQECFIEGSTALFAHILDSVLLGAIRLERHADVLKEANVIASLMMRALLRNPSDIESIKQEVRQTELAEISSPERR